MQRPVLCRRGPGEPRVHGLLQAGGVVLDPGGPGLLRCGAQHDRRLVPGDLQEDQGGGTVLPPPTVTSHYGSERVYLSTGGVRECHHYTWGMMESSPDRCEVRVSPGYRFIESHLATGGVRECHYATGGVRECHITTGGVRESHYTTGGMRECHYTTDGVRVSLHDR